MTDNVFQHDNRDAATTTSSSSSPIIPDVSRPPIPPLFVAPSSQTIQPPTFLYVIPYVLFIFFTIGVLSASRIFRFYNVHCGKCRWLRRNPNDDDDDESDDESEWESSRESRDALVVALGISDRIQLYRRAFDRNKHHHTLTAEDFLPEEKDNNKKLEVGSSSGDNDNDIESSGEKCRTGDTASETTDDLENPSWIYLPLPSSTPSLHHIEQDSLDESDAPYATSPKHSADATSSLTTKIPGTCIICFENFRVGDTVVWSDDVANTCKHVFHEDCMVRYLATHSLRTKSPSSYGRRRSNSDDETISGNYWDNPCPTCRQPFCKVRHDDLVMAVLLKSVSVALSPDDDDDEPTEELSFGGDLTDSERSERIVTISLGTGSARSNPDV
jgi:hypothetical protein